MAFSDSSVFDNSQNDRGSRAEHLAWCKQRALEYVDRGDLTGALASMTSDLRKHAETQSSVTLCGELGVALAMSGHLNTPEKMRKWIEGFN
jgi:hypothetical protein